MKVLLELKYPEDPFGFVHYVCYKCKQKIDPAYKGPGCGIEFVDDYAYHTPCAMVLLKKEGQEP